MADEKKYLNPIESKGFNDLPGAEHEIERIILSFAPREWLPIIARASKTMHKITGEDPAYYLQTPGERGADLCRDALRRNSGDIKARNRLAFLWLMQEATFKQGDPEDSFTVLREDWQNHHNLDSGYYLAKFYLELNIPNRLVKDVFQELLLANNREHLGALCGIANLCLRGGGLITANETDFLFPDSPPSLPLSPASTRGLELYRMARSLHPTRNHEILCSLANSLRNSSLIFEPNALPEYVAFIRPDVPVEQPILMNSTNPRHELAALCYRSILRQNPQHIEAARNLAQLIGYPQVSAQPEDFLPEEKINGQIPPTLVDQELSLLRRIQWQHARARWHIENCHQMLELCYERELWQDHLRGPFVDNFKNLTYTKRQLLSSKRVSFSQNCIQEALDHDLASRITDKKFTSALIYIIAIISTAALTPLYIMANRLAEVSSRTLNLAGVTALHLVLVGTCLYLLRNRINRKDLDKLIKKEVIYRLCADDETLAILFPERYGRLNPVEKKALRLLREIPREKWGRMHKDTFIHNFFTHRSTNRRQLVVNQIIATRPVSNYPSVKKARAVEVVGMVLPPMVVLAGCGYGMYKTWDRLLDLDQDIGIQFLVVFLQGISAAVLATCVYYWAKDTLEDQQLVEKAEKSVREDLIMDLVFRNLQ